jgi:hypothetical protein
VAEDALRQARRSVTVRERETRPKKFTVEVTKKGEFLVTLILFEEPLTVIINDQVIE